MENPTGRVVSLVDKRSGARAVVEVDAASACPRCAAGKGCGAGLLQPGDVVAIDDAIFGYPYDSLADLPDGDYVVQALLHRYETFRLASGKTVKLPMDRGEGQQWRRAPGNLYSEPATVAFAKNDRSLIGIEIVDESDDTTDMQVLARRRWERRARALGLVPPSYEGVTGVAGVLQSALEAAGRPAVSLRVGIPHYLMNAEHPQAVQAVLDHAEERVDRLCVLLRADVIT